MSFPGCRPQALASLSFCVLVLACVVGEEELGVGYRDPAAAWGVSVLDCEACRSVRVWESVSGVAVFEKCVHGVGTDDPDHEFALVCVSAKEHAGEVNVCV